VQTAETKGNPLRVPHEAHGDRLRGDRNTKRGRERREREKRETETEEPPQQSVTIDTEATPCRFTN
jgi:hypothetical protein